MISLRLIKNYDKNAKRHPKEQVDLIAKSIKEFGFRNPILLNNLNEKTIVAGHGRLLAAKQLNMSQVPCLSAEDMTKEQIKAFRIMDNKSQESEWDMDLIKFEMKELEELGYDTTLTGFEFEGFEPPKEVREDDFDTDASLNAIKYKVERGDVWELGNHRLMCGDSTDKETVDVLMNGEKADMVFTDPPYNIAFKPQRGTHDKILNDDMSDEEFVSFLDNTFQNADSILKDNSYLFSFSGWSTIPSFNTSLRKFFTIKAMPIWVKNNFGIGYYSRPKYEPFFLCLKGEPTKPVTAPADVWECAKVHKTIHSCEKPIKLVSDIMAIYGFKGLCYDPFGGSGSTLIASEQLNRKCFMMELDPKYCSVIIERWEKYTGLVANKL